MSSVAVKTPLVGVAVLISEPITIMRRTEVTDWNNLRLHVLPQEQRNLSCFTESTGNKSAAGVALLKLNQSSLPRRIKCPAAKRVNIYYAIDSFLHTTKYIGFKFMPQPND